MTEKSKIPSNGDALEIVKNLQEVKRSISILEKQKERITQQLYNFMGENEVMFDHETGEEIVNWSYSKGAIRFDAKRFELERPKLYKEYLKAGEPVRVLRVVK